MKYKGAPINLQKSPLEGRKIDPNNLTMIEYNRRGKPKDPHPYKTYFKILGVSAITLALVLAIFWAICGFDFDELLWGSWFIWAFRIITIESAVLTWRWCWNWEQRIVTYCLLPTNPLGLTVWGLALIILDALLWINIKLDFDTY